MSKVELKKSLEAILMVVDEPVSEVVLAQITEVPTEEVVAELNEMAASNFGLSLGDGAFTATLISLPW
jgi:segregation and condensation protein B